jgi:hypothetical protein
MASFQHEIFGFEIDLDEINRGLFWNTKDKLATKRSSYIIRLFLDAMFLIWFNVLISRQNLPNEKWNTAYVQVAYMWICLMVALDFLTILVALIVCQVCICNPYLLLNYRWNVRVGTLYCCVYNLLCALYLCVIILDFIAHLVKNIYSTDDYRNQVPTEKEKLVEVLTRLCQVILGIQAFCTSLVFYMQRDVKIKKSVKSVCV